MEEEQMEKDVVSEMKYGDNARVQKVQWIKNKMEKQREAEDKYLEKILEEQKVIQELNISIDEGMEQTLERRRYNQEFQEDLKNQIYELNGVSADMIEGMKISRSSFYLGFTFCSFLLSVALIIVTGIIHGFQSEISLFMLAGTGVEAALLTQDKRGKIMNKICACLHLLIFPMMFIIFLCFELKYMEYDLLLPYFSIAVIVLLLLSTISGFLYNPYRFENKKVKSAKKQIKVIEKNAQKEVKKNVRYMKKIERLNIRKKRWENILGTIKNFFHGKKQLLTEAEGKQEIQEPEKIQEIEENKVLGEKTI